MATNFHARDDFTIWGWQERVYWSTTFTSCFAAVIAGPWIWWRARGPIGAWVTIAALLMSAWFGVEYWPNRAGFWFYLVAPSVSVMLLALAITGWPVGRFERRWIRPLQAYALWQIASVLTTFIGSDSLGTPPFGWTSWPITAYGSHSLGVVVHAMSAIVWHVVSVAIMVALVRRHRRLPAGVHKQARPVLAAGLVLWGSGTYTFLSNFLAAPLEWRNGHGTVLGVMRVVADYSATSNAIVLLAVAVGIRNRFSAGQNNSVIEIDVGTQSPVRPADEEIAELLGDPSTRLLYTRHDGIWIDGEGRTVDPDRPGRTRFEMVDRDGIVIAALDRDSSRWVGRTAVESAASRVQLHLLHARRQAEAGARLVELRALQRAVIDAQDAARQRLERDLHDGAQQRVVGLFLGARLLARQAERSSAQPDEREQLAHDVADAAEETRRLIADTAPAALANGLGSALMLLAASSPVRVDLALRGDVRADNPLARPLWLIANDAVANAMKHAGPTLITIELDVFSSSVTLTVTDDGRGGVQSPPASLENRIVQLGGTVSVTSPVNGGTTIVITVLSDQPVTASTQTAMVTR